MLILKKIICKIFRHKIIVWHSFGFPPTTDAKCKRCGEDLGEEIRREQPEWRIE